MAQFGRRWDAPGRYKCVKFPLSVSKISNFLHHFERGWRNRKHCPKLSIPALTKGSHSSQGHKWGPQNSAPPSWVPLLIGPKTGSLWKRVATDYLFCAKIYITQNVPFLPFLSVQLSDIKCIHTVVQPKLCNLPWIPKDSAGAHGMFSFA